MAGERKISPLDDLLDDVLDRRGVTPIKLGSDFTKSGHRVISAKLIKDGRIDLAADDPRFVDDETYARWMKTPLLPDDVILTSEAPLGEVAYISKELDWCLGQRLFGLRTKKDRLYGQFLYYALRSSEVVHDLQSRATGTTAQGIRQTELRKVLVPEPPVDEQRAIAHILGTLDDKIELNRRMNETLEAIARAIFKSWFVDFDPVRAKASGEPSESICRRLGLTPDLLALFPDRLIDSELGEIPEGWGQKRVDDLMELAYGKALKASDRVAGAVPVYGSGGITGYHNELLVDGPGIIVGRKGTVGSLYWEDRSFFPIDTVFYVVPKVQLTFCYYLLQTLGLDRMNTDAAVPGLNRNNVYRLPVAWSPDGLRQAFDRVAKPLRDRLFAHKQESKTLEDIRDTLLPKLLSGELRVPVEGEV